MAVILVVGLAVGCSARTSANPPVLRKIVYTVSGTGRRAHVTYATATGQQQQDVAVSWIDAETLPGPAVLLAQAVGSARITCRIIIDGVEASVNTSEGDQVIVTCRA